MHWAEANVAQPNLVKEDVAALGITLAGELAEEAEAAEAEPDLFAVLPENWEAVRLFERCCRQWRYKNGDELVSLDVTAVVSVLNLYQLPPEQQLERLDQVQLIEYGALLVIKNSPNKR